MPRTALICLLAASCGPGDPPAEEPALPEPPAGAVVRVGPGETSLEPVYVLDREIDRWVDTVARLEPEETRRSWRRKALKICLERAVVAALFPDERAAARAQIGSLREPLVAGRELPDDAPHLERARGHALDLHPFVWGAAVELEAGRWSEVLELPGSFVVVRPLDPSPEGGWKPHHQLRVELLRVPFVRPEEVGPLILDARPELGVTPLNPPGWEDILPAYYEFE